MKAILVLLLLASLAGGASGGRAEQSAPGELVFVRGRPSDGDLWLIREDGTGLRRLTSVPGGVGSPQWSPDGSKLVFSGTRDGDDEIFVMNADGTGVRKLTRNRASDVTPAWSPDGRWIAFASDRSRPQEHELWVMRSDGTGARRLLTNPRHAWQDVAFSPTWSPDGKRLAFTANRAGSENPELYMIGRDGKGLRRVTFTRGSVGVLGDDTMPDWSRDGASIVFVSNRQGQSDVWRMSPNGKSQRPVRRVPSADEWHPRLSGDGRRIAFTDVPAAGASSVWVMDADGSGAKRLTTGSEADWR